MVVLNKQSQKNLIELNNLSQSFELIDLNITGNELSKDKYDILVFYSDYNLTINQSLLCGYLNCLKSNRFEGLVGTLKVPGGAFELPLLSSKIIKKYSPKLCLVVGCIVKGETQHYEFLSSTVTNAIRNVSFENNIPILNGILTVENEQQAIDRAGKKMDKGSEFARASMDIINFNNKFDV
jgi:6,7-dimethyl-8-ribityllumazine synthase